MTLYHQFDALTNTRGDSLPGYRVIARLPNGGAIQPIYGDPSGTPIISTSGLADTAVTDAAGNYSFFITANATYDLEYQTPAGVFLSATRNVPMIAGIKGDQGDPGPSNNTRNSLAALKAAATTDLTSLYDGSLWTWQTSAAPYTADDMSVVKADSTALSIGAWVRQTSKGIVTPSAFSGRTPATVATKLEHIVPLSEFAAAGLSDKQVVDAAIVASNGRTPENVPGGISQGTVIQLPQGTLSIPASLAKVTKNGSVTLRGMGKGVTRLDVSATGDLFTLDPSALAPYNYDTGGGLEDMSIVYPSAPAATACVMRCLTTHSSWMRNVAFKNVAKLVHLGDVATGKKAPGHTMSNVTGTCANIANLALIEGELGSGLTVLPDCFGYVDDPAVQIALLEDYANGGAAVRTTTHAAATGRVAFAFGKGRFDEAKIGGDFLLFDRGLSVNVLTGQSVTNIEVVSAVFDYCKSHAVFLRANPNATLANVVVLAGYMVGWDGRAVELQSADATALVANITIADSIMGACGVHGIEMSGAGCKYVTLRNNAFYGAGRINSGNPAGIYVHDGASNFLLTDNKTEQEAFSYQWLPKYGVYVAADLDRYVVAHNNLRGGTKNYQLDANTVASVDRIVKDNLRADYVGFMGGAAYTLPASGSAWTNKSAARVAVHLGTGFTALTKGTQALPYTQGSVLVDPGQAITASYASGSPTILFEALNG